MKLISMKTIIFSILIFSQLALAQSFSGASSIACSGQLRGSYFYVYTYQYIQSNNGYDIDSESHNLQLQGVFSGEHFRQIGFDGRHMIYKSKNFKLAVPYSYDESLFYKDLRRGYSVYSSPRRERYRAHWRVLCAR